MKRDIILFIKKNGRIIIDQLIGEEELVEKKQKGALVGFGLMGDQQHDFDSHCCCVIPENPQSFRN